MFRESPSGLMKVITQSISVTMTAEGGFAAITVGGSGVARLPEVQAIPDPMLPMTRAGRNSPAPTRPGEGAEERSPQHPPGHDVMPTSCSAASRCRRLLTASSRDGR